MGKRLRLSRGLLYFTAGLLGYFIAIHYGVRFYELLFLYLQRKKVMLLQQMETQLDAFSEQLDAHVDSIDLNSFQIEKGDSSAVLAKICSIYQMVRPLLEFLSRFIFVPKKWKDVIKAFMATLDGLCPTQ